MADIAIPQNLADRFGGIDQRVRQVERQGVWFALALGAAWQQYPGFEAAAFRKVDDIVEVRGLIRRSSGSPATGETLFTLPTGYRPPATTVLFAALDGGAVPGVSRVDIATTGVCTWVAGTAANAALYLSLTPIRFSTTLISTLTAPT